jgi:NAD(P)-dependent dehydrogenase (short-subunit alcohol dehydrogenase family)
MSKRLLITGGSRGIGAATARLAAARGYDVAINYAGNRAAAEAVVAGIEKHGRKGVAIQGDMSKPEDVERLFATVDKELGRIDAFFNNAGIAGPISKLVDMPVERIQKTFALNTVGAFVAAQEAVRRMSTRLGGNGGAIVNMSSMAAKAGAPNDGTDYGASKGAIDTFTVGLAKEVAGEGIRVNAVRPGLIYTEIHATMGQPDRVDNLRTAIPLQRGGTPEDVGEAVLWLMSDQASYIIGQLVDVAGGRAL